MRFGQLIDGAVAGLVATGPMTIAMIAMHRYLPFAERYSLPPREITMEIAEDAGFERQLTAAQQTALTMTAHFSYGAAAGIVFSLFDRIIPLPYLVKGIAFGLLVWTGSYLGLLPGMGILRPASQHPKRRNALMIASHVVWGATAAIMLDELERGGAIAGRGVSKRDADR